MFKALKDLPYSLLLSTEVHTIAKRTLTVVKRLLKDVPFIDRQITAAEKSLIDLEQSLKSSNRSAFTEVLAGKDLRRDTVFRSIISYLDGVHGMRIRPEKSRDAAYLLSLFEKQGRYLDRIGYAQESAKVRLLIDELKLPQAQAAIAGLGLQDAVEEMEAAQEDFEATYHVKVTTDTQSSSPLTYDARGEVLYRLNNMLTYIDAEVTDFPAEHGVLCQELNEMITDIVSRARARKTMNENAREEPQAIESAVAPVAN